MRYGTPHTKAVSRTRMALLIFCATLTLVGTPNPLFAHEAEEDKNYTELLSSAIASDSKPENCLSIRRFKNTEILDNQHLLFMATGRAWLNKMPTECNAFKRAKVLVFDRYVRRICNRDSVKGSDPKTGSITGSCTIGNFVEIEKSLARRLIAVSKKD